MRNREDALDFLNSSW